MRLLQKVIFSCVRPIFFVFESTFSTAEDNSRATVFKTLFLVFFIILSISENLYVFLLNVERDELGLRGRNASPFASPVFTPLSA